MSASRTCRAHGYFFCDGCEDTVCGPRCDHNNGHAVRWVHVPLTATTAAEARKPVVERTVSQERGRELWAQLFDDLGLPQPQH